MFVPACKVPRVFLVILGNIQEGPMVKILRPCLERLQASASTGAIPSDGALTGCRAAKRPVETAIWGLVASVQTVS